MSVLVDTNVLLRRTQPGHGSHAVAVESVARLLGSGEPVHFTPQNIAEFWNVVTRPVANNLTLAQPRFGDAVGPVEKPPGGGVGVCGKTTGEINWPAGRTVHRIVAMGVGGASG